jgi:SH3 domain protein
MPKKHLSLALFLACLLTESVWSAHITDTLVVGVYPSPKVEGQPLQLLSSGAPLEVLRREDGFAEVRLADGTTGWVEADYVTDEKPAKAMLLETQARLRQMGLELAKLRGEPAVENPDAAQRPGEAGDDTGALVHAEQRIAELQSALAAQRQASDAQERLDRLNAQVREALESLAATQGLTLQQTGAVPPAPFFERYQTLIIGLAALVLGFGSGVAFIDYRIRKRYGGFRI